jgi:hypothetical protein
MLAAAPAGRFAAVADVWSGDACCGLRATTCRIAPTAMRTPTPNALFNHSAAAIGEATPN